MKIKQIFVYLLALTTLSLPLYSQAQTNPPVVRKAPVGSGAAARNPVEELSAKAFLEDLMARRYSQGLSTVIDPATFKMGVQIELSDLPKKEDKKAPETETPFDLMVGTLDPEKLIEQYDLSQNKEALLSLFATKRIKSILFNVGLRDDLGEPVKQSVETWLDARMKSEFGSVATREVSFIAKVPPAVIEKPPVKKEWYDWLLDFQFLAAALILALTIAFGIILWRLTTAKTDESKKIKDDMGLRGLDSEINEKQVNSSGTGDSEAQELVAKTKLAEDLVSMTIKINGLSTRIVSDLPQMIKSWCRAGDEGLIKVSCFAEAVGRDLGRLPIPPEFARFVSEAINKMPSMDPKDKLKNLENVYWDLVSVLNLGPDVLNQPFSYLSNVEPQLINQVLMEQNPKLKTLVSLFLPANVREDFIRPMTKAQKLQLLESAATLSEIDSKELKSMDQSVMKNFVNDGSSDSIRLESSLEKVIQALNPIEEIELLNQLVSPELNNYKMLNPSLAFIHQWPDEDLSRLVAEAKTEQLVAYLRLKPEVQERVINLCPPIAGTVLKDDLNRDEIQPEEDKIRILNEFKSILVTMIEQKEFNLARIFENSGTSLTDNKVAKFKSA